jgi:hypothetical protein
VQVEGAQPGRWGVEELAQAGQFGREAQPMHGGPARAGTGVGLEEEPARPGD